MSARYVVAKDALGWGMLDTKQPRIAPFDSPAAAELGCYLSNRYGPEGYYFREVVGEIEQPAQQTVTA